MEKLRPTSKQDRFEILDVLRGFSLIGIVTANMILYSLYLYLNKTQMQKLPTYSIDRILDYIELTFIKGKFYTIFSILFGIGFSILLRRASQKGIAFHRFFLRRVFFLFLIGLAHAILVWNDDILEFYALCGSLLLFFLNRSDRTILICSAIALLLPVPIAMLGGIPRQFFSDIRDIFFQGTVLDRDTSIRIWTTGSYVEILSLNFYKWFAQVTNLVTSGMLFKIFGNFLLGFYIGRNQIYHKLDSYKSQLRKLMIWGFALGLPLNVLYAITFSADSLLRIIIAAIGILPLSLAYLSSVCLLWLKEDWKKRLLLFAPVGRMALTNYVSQSIICTLIFYNTGLALGGKLGPTIYLPIGILVYCAQVLFSAYWLKNFQYGPLEWIWRMATYGKWLNPISYRTDDDVQTVKF